MTGRDVFKFLGGVFNLMAKIICVFPRCVRVWLLRVFRNTGGNFGNLVRYILVKSLAKECGNNVGIRQYVILQHLENMVIGDNVSIHPFCYMDAEGGLVTLSDNVAIAHNSSILTTNHTWDDPNVPIKYNKITCEGVSIDEDVWIGCGCRIMAGVHIGTRSVVAAGAVVTKDVEPNSVVGGVPAKLIKKI